MSRHGSITRTMNKGVKRKVAKAEAATGNTNGIFETRIRSLDFILKEGD